MKARPIAFLTPLLTPAALRRLRPHLFPLPHHHTTGRRAAPRKDGQRRLPPPVHPSLGRDDHGANSDLYNKHGELPRRHAQQRVYARGPGGLELHIVAWASARDGRVYGAKRRGHGAIVGHHQVSEEIKKAAVLPPIGNPTQRPLIYVPFTLTHANPSICIHCAATSVLPSSQVPQPTSR